MYKININAWFGRFGNNLTQLSNALYFAEKTSSDMSYPEHSSIQNKVFNFSKNSASFTTIDSIFWDDFEHNLFNIKEADSNRRRILKKYFLPLIKYEKKHLPYDIVVHIRGGDICQPNPHLHYVQMPSSYFLKIFEKEKSQNILILSEDKRNPVIEVLLKSGFNCTFQSSEMREDINMILNAKKVIIGGISSFANNLLLCSENIEKIYYPIIENSPLTSRFITETEISFVSCQDYIKFGEWKFDEQQKKMLVEHQMEKIYIKE